jgi:hypothetical protein
VKVAFDETKRFGHKIDILNHWVNSLNV